MRSALDVLVNPATLYVASAEQLSAEITAADPLLKTLTFSAPQAHQLPPGLTFSITSSERGIIKALISGAVNFGLETSFSIPITVTNGVQTVSRELRLERTHLEELKPVFDAVAPREAFATEQLSLYVSAGDREGAPISYSAYNIPFGASFSGSLRHFNWVPTRDQVGVHHVTFVAANKFGTTEMTVPIEVKLRHTLPVFAPVQNLVAYPRVNLNFDVHATDTQESQIAYSARSLPAGAAFDPSTRTFSWTPAEEQIGSWTVVFVAANDVGLAEMPVKITVQYRPPDIASPDWLERNQGEKIEFAVWAKDPENRPFTVSVNGLPRGATFDPLTRIFSWTPSYDQFGEFLISFKAANAVAFAESATSIVVKLVPPRWIKVPQSQMVTLGRSFTFQLLAEAVSGEPLSYTVDYLPDKATFDPVSGLFSWVPRHLGTGWMLTFAVSNGITSNEHHVEFWSSVDSPVAIGNYVFHDRGNGGRFDPGIDYGIANVPIELWEDLNENGVFEPGGADAQKPRTTVTDKDGRYYFGGLWSWSPEFSALSDDALLESSKFIPAGQYFVRIPPAAFASNAPLFRMVNSLGVSSDFTEDEIVSEKGVNDINYLANGIVSAPIGAQAGAGPAGENSTNLPPYYQDQWGTYFLDDACTFLTVDFGFHPPIPTLASIGEVSPKWVNGEAVVSWTTISEIGTLGFYLWRWDESSAMWKKVTEEFVPGRYPQIGGKYQLVDPAAKPSLTYQYLLEEVESWGSSLWHGPYALTFILQQEMSTGAGAKSARSLRRKVPLGTSVLRR